GIVPTAVPPVGFASVLRFVPVERQASWLQRNGSLTVAKQAALGDVKHQSSVSYGDQSAEVDTWAGWCKVNNQDLEDFDGLQQDLANQFPVALNSGISGDALAAVLGSTGLAVPDFTPFAPDVVNLADAIQVARAIQVAAGYQVDFALV